MVVFGAPVFHRGNLAFFVAIFSEMIQLFADGAVREVMKELLRSDLRFHKTDCGRFGAMTAWGLKDTSSRPAKDLGGTLRHTIRTMLRSYDSRASGDLLLYRSIGLIMPIFVRG